MPKIKFVPGDREFDVEANAKILAVARKHKLPMRFGCAACQCGTCAVEVSGKGIVSTMAFEEKALLQKIGLRLDGSVRLGCRTRLIAGDITVDLSFQDKYSPDGGMLDGAQDRPVAEE